MSTLKKRPPPQPGSPPPNILAASAAAAKHNLTQKVRESPAASSETISMYELIRRRDELSPQISDDNSIQPLYKNELLKKSSRELDTLISNKKSEIANYYTDNAENLGTKADTLQNELTLLKNIKKLIEMEENIERLEREAIELYESTGQELTSRQNPQASIEQSSRRILFDDETDDDNEVDELDGAVSIQSRKKPLDVRQNKSGSSTVYPGPRPGGKRKTHRRKAKKTRKQRKGKKARKNKTMRR